MFTTNSLNSGNNGCIKAKGKHRILVTAGEFAIIDHRGVHDGNSLCHRSIGSIGIKWLILENRILDPVFNEILAAQLTPIFCNQFQSHRSLLHREGTTTGSTIGKTMTELNISARETNIITLRSTITDASEAHQHGFNGSGGIRVNGPVGHSKSPTSIQNL